MVPRVTAIVLNWCNESDTAACIDSLLSSTYDSLTVLLVDNGSPDGSGDRLRSRYPGVSYLQTGANLGYAGGNNRGIDQALASRAEYLLVVNDDTVLDAGCVGELVRAAQETNAALVAPMILYFDDPTRVWYGGGDLSTLRAVGIHRRENKRMQAEPRRSAITFVTGCCFLARGDVIENVGGFDERFFAYVEDTELSVRLARAGYQMQFEPRARVFHRIRPRAAATAFQIRQRDRNRRMLVRRHYRPAARIAFMSWFYPTRALHLASHLLHGDWERARAIVEGAVGGT